jgi:hypothetical protein
LFAGSSLGFGVGLLPLGALTLCQAATLIDGVDVGEDAPPVLPVAVLLAMLIVGSRQLLRPPTSSTPRPRAILPEQHCQDDVFAA